MAPNPDPRSMLVGLIGLALFVIAAIAVLVVAVSD